MGDTGRAKDDILVLNNVKKYYKSFFKCGKGKYAVRGVSLAIPKGECFGLLGINGAGKTSTLNILGGKAAPTSGSAYMKGVNIEKNPEVILKNVGFCPQFDALFPVLTAKEHLDFYANIKCFPEDLKEKVVNAKIKEMLLTDYALRQAGGYSGGMKRKLSTAIAMIGGPEIIFLDEPSTGMDPVARRSMWNIISNISKEKKESAVILTTHSMEECEALSTRIGIMVDGRLRCIGSNQHLKNKFGSGYQIEISLKFSTKETIQSESTFLKELNLSDLDSRIKLSEVNELLNRSNNGVYNSFSDTDEFKNLFSDSNDITLYQLASTILIEERVDKLNQFLEEKFPGLRKLERQEVKMRYEIPVKNPINGETNKLWYLFDTFNKNSQLLNISDYSLSQSSLEQIFNEFAAQQEGETLEK